jgi:hypothetical protein
VVAGLIAISAGSANAALTVTKPDSVWVEEGTTLSFQITVNNPDGCVYSLDANHLLPAGNDAAWNPPLPGTYYLPTDNFTFTWTPTLDDAGTYAIRYATVVKDLQSPCYRRTPVPRGLTVIVVTEAGGAPQFGSVSGRVTADCPNFGTALGGVPVDILQAGSGNPLASAVTDVDGAYSLSGIPVGPCTVNIATPLGYTASSASAQVEVIADQNVVSDFELTCQTVVPAARAGGFWGHQFVVATGGKGNAQVDPATLCSYLDLVEGHFNNNSVNPVVVYGPPASGQCIEKLWEGRILLNLHGSVDMVDRARRQLLALLLNAASGNLGLFQTASEDGATISQAITYCDNLIDDDTGDHELAKNIAEMINNGETVPAGMIPLSTANIAYRGRTLLHFAAGPSPASGNRTFRFAMARGGHVSLRIFDVNGRLISRVYDGALGAGQHTLSWKARGEDGAKLSAGVYFVQLSTGSEMLRTKIVQMDR